MRVAPLTVLTLALAGVAQLGCGPCQQIAAHRDAFQQRTSPVGDQPHLAVAIPRKLVDDAIQKGLARIRPKELDIPGLGQIARYVDKLKLSPKRIGIERAQAEGQYRVALDLDVGFGNSSLFTMSLGTETAPVSDAKKGTVALSVRADMLESVTPSIPDSAVARLTNAMLSKLPAPVKLIVPRAEVDRLSRTAIGWLSQNAVRLLRDQVLTPMGELASFKFQMPDLPLAALELVSDDGAFQILARTTLPVQRGLPKAALSDSAKTARSTQSDDIQVRLATGAVVELANWAMSRGDLPNAFNMDGKPEQGGSFSAGLEWVGGERPLKINAWSAQGTCIRARIGANPLVALKEGKLDLGVAGVQLEELDGPPLFKQATQWATNLWDEAAGTSKTRISTAKFGLAGGKEGGMDVTRVNLEGDALVFSLGSAPKATTTRTKKRTSQRWAPVSTRGRCGD
ncbi:MAG: hypothetical protein H6702_15220 [Myxococcales bacterium]|nr:hypothetical protein [Myxococcales bacterium]